MSITSSTNPITRLRSPVLPYELARLEDEHIRHILQETDPAISAIMLRRWFYDKSPGINISIIASTIALNTFQSLQSLGNASTS